MKKLIINKRRKAFLGADGAITAAATLAAAGINAAATAKAADTQAKAMLDNAESQSNAIKEQTENNNNLQKEQLAFTRQENQENRNQQQDIQTTLQLLAGRNNMNDRLEANKRQLKLGGSNSSQPFYGGDNSQFKVIDGGGVIPIYVTNEGYGLYEIYGNDHEHYHKTSNGKNKTGVGIKFKDGSVVEGEGNQNTNKGELLYVTPNDAMFISKHSIDGFNPREAVKSGIAPEEAFMIQEYLKDINNLNDDGSKTKHKSIKKLNGGINHINNYSNNIQYPFNKINLNNRVNYNNSSPVEESSTQLPYYNNRIKLKCGGRRKAEWGDYAGATYSSIGNLIGAGINFLGNSIASRRLGAAYDEAGKLLSDAYSNMKGIDLSELNREDYNAPHSIAVIRSANTNINPQLERIKRNASSEINEINRGTLSSAARQQRIAATNDRTMQRIGEQYAYKQNLDEQIKQQNAERITQSSETNAARDAQARQNFANQRLSLLQYNNNIENEKLAGIAQAKADALTQSATVRAASLQNSMNALSNSIVTSGNAFASAENARIKRRDEVVANIIGMNDLDKTNYIIANKNSIDDRTANFYYDSLQRRYNLSNDATEKSRIAAEMNRINSEFNLKRNVIN